MTKYVQSCLLQICRERKGLSEFPQKCGYVADMLYVHSRSILKMLLTSTYYFQIKMPRKKKVRLCLPKKGFWKKPVSDEKGPMNKLTKSITEQQDNECVLNIVYPTNTQSIDYLVQTNIDQSIQTYIPGLDQSIQTNFPGIDQGIQTEELIKSDHDYCANLNTSSDLYHR